jgi:uncharacterized membrane protein
MADTAPPLGPDPRVASTAAYAAWWVSGALVYLVERDRPAVRFHAMQAVVAFGTIWLAWMTCWVGSFVALLVSSAGFFLLQRLAGGVLIAGLIVWAVCLWQAAHGVEIRLPVFADWTDRVLAALASPTSPRSTPPARD